VLCAVRLSLRQGEGSGLAVLPLVLLLSYSGEKNIAYFEQKMSSTMLKSFHPRKDPTKAIEQALDRAIELSVRTRRYTITDGRLVYERHRRYRYAYTLTQGSWDLPDGTDLQLSSSDLANSLPVELSNTKDDSVTITVTQRLTERTLALRAAGGGSCLSPAQAERSLSPREHLGPIRLEAPRRARLSRW
jgi:hypothetical protein